MAVLSPNANVERSQRSRCWSCSTDMEADTQFCPKCGKLQSGLAQDYFSFFGLPRRFELDRGALEKQFYRFSRKLHPDLFARATPQEQQWSLEKSSVLNDAWRTLRDPIRRTEYLLGLEGIRLEEQSRDATDVAIASGTAKEQVVPPDLLEEVFELNMQLEEMRMASASGADDPELKENLEAAKRNFDAQMAEAERNLQNLWTEWDTAAEAQDADAQKAALQEIVDLLNRRGYIRNLVRDVQEALGGSEPVTTVFLKEDKAG
jgi:molecular chaperone HscB